MPPKRRLTGGDDDDDSLQDPLATDDSGDVVMSEVAVVNVIEADSGEQDPLATGPPQLQPQQQRPRSITPEPGKKRKKIDPVS